MTNDRRPSGYPSKRIFYFKVRDQPYGAWRWRRNRMRGVVLRVGPLGHVQAQAYRMRFFGRVGTRDGRRGRHGIEINFWGVKGRRRKRGIGINVTL